jgi:PAS domain S-box-containing protein
VTKIGPVAAAIDEGQLAEERSRSETGLRLLFKHMPGAVWAVDRDLRITYATGHLLNVMGAQGLVGTSTYDFLGTHDPTNAVIAHHLAALAGNNQSFEYSFFDRWYAIGVEPLRDANASIVGCVGIAVDVTEQREVAGRLASSERRLVEAQRVAHVGSFEWDIQRDVLTWSDELQRIYGFEPGTFGGTFEAFMARVPPDDAAATRKVIFDAYARQSPFTYDHRIIRTDGSVRMLHSRGDVVRDDRGTPVRIVGTCWDVTEQRNLVAQLEQAISRWEATIESTGEGILVVDLNGEVAQVNQRFLTLWRVERPSNARAHHLALLSPVMSQLEEPDEFAGRLEEIYAQPEQESFDVVRFKDGRVFECRSTPQRIGKRVTGRVFSVHDVTEREALLNRALFLADATRLLASLEVEQALDAVAHLAVPYLGAGCAIDLFGNGSPRRLITFSRDPWTAISTEVHPDVLRSVGVIYPVGSISNMGVPFVIEGRLVGAITLVAPPHRTYTRSDMDLVEELARRAALAVDNARLYRHARDAIAARDEFLSVAAHEIRGPTNAIHMAVQSVRQAKVPEGALPRVVGIIERQDLRLSQFVDELLEVGRIQAGALRLAFEDVDLGSVVHEVVARLGPQLSRSGSSLTVTDGSKVVGQWDKDRVDQVVYNLISNAIKFGLGKPIDVSVGVRDGHAILTTRDHGMGISPDVRSRLFKPFERGVSGRHFGGLGLGLYIVKTIVEALGGSVTLETEPGVGSTIMVDLPQTQVPQASDGHPHH